MFFKLNQIRRSVFALACSSALLSLTLVAPATGADLGEALDSVNGRVIIGTWVDSETKGERIKVVYSWKFKNKLIEVNTKMGESESVALMGFNPATEEVYMVGANNKGGGSIGKWTMDGEDAVLELSYVSEEGETGKMSYKHHWVDKDTIEVSGMTEDGQQAFTLTLVRAK